MDEPAGLILLDITSGRAADFDASFLERNGHAVAMCHGPDHGTLCPLLAGHGCEMVDGAHGIVFALDLDRAQHRAILQRYREVTRPDVPIRVIVPSGQSDRYADLLQEFEVWTSTPTVADLDGFAAETEAADRA